MKEFVVPAVVTADPDANASDLLVDRVALTPEGALFSLPTADGGWSDVTAREFHEQVVALARPNALVVSGWALAHPALTGIALPEGVPEGRYFAYRANPP